MSPTFDNPNRVIAEPDDLVRRVHSSGRQIVLAVTGGGSGVIEQLLSVPGGSRTVLEARVPYAATAINDWLRAVPESYCSARTARAMAMSAFQRADCLSNRADDPSSSADQLVGIGVTASLASEQPKRGTHRVHAAVQTASSTTEVTLTLDKGFRSRREEEQLVAALLLNVVAHGCGVDAAVALPLTDNETVESRTVTATSEWQELLTGKRDKMAAFTLGGGSGDNNSNNKHPVALFPGAFNPRHQGHHEMAAIAAKVLGGPIAHELSIENVDKPPLDFIEIEDRLAHFTTRDTVWLTRAATFVAKARLFPGVTFIVGADTLRRIAEPRYYQQAKFTACDAIDQLAAAGCRFLMFGRAQSGPNKTEQFQSLDDLDLPTSLAAICDEVPESEFRRDISSTALRSQQIEDDN